MSVNSSNPTDVERFTDTCDMGLEGKGIIEDNIIKMVS